MSMRIIPASSHSTTFSHGAKTTSAPSAPGVYDTLRQGLGPSQLPTTTSSSSAIETPPPTSRHPLEARLKSWEATQESARMEMLRKTFGMAEPIRRGMELKMVREGSWRPLALAGSGSAAGVHEDILRGRDAYLDWEDVFTGEEQRGGVAVQDEMERKLKI
ncbi:putative proteasome maturation factor protein [Eutypa lata UCREL1]|uniref:Putative proteasome maturation factor protein n=1 Tax=Eutypa lata (strain UCR-EL1) TaxID=1287681 RepID=M7SW77_EUTLA|nr:putative proteasome maturation factor protein [Eutypa lata UCREL1]